MPECTHVNPSTLNFFQISDLGQLDCRKPIPLPELEQMSIFKKERNAVLALEDGSVFRGFAFGAKSTVVEEAFLMQNDRISGNPDRSFLFWPDCHHDQSPNQSME